jgi:heterodisulfide reductase subunit C
VADIVMNDLDKEFKYEVAARPGASFFKRCFSCGTCTASCPVSEIDERFNPRLFIRQALLGEREKLLSSELLWYCTQCYTCFARCPQDVRFTDVMAVFREMAVEQGYAPKQMPEKIKQVDLLSQQLRHGLAELALASTGRGDAAAVEKSLKGTLAKGLKEIQQQ